VSRRLLVVHHSRTGSTAALRDAALAGAAAAAEDGEESGESVEVVSLGAFDATADDVLSAHAVLLCTPANFGYMSGALKDFFERIYHPCLDATVALPYALVVKGDTDVAGAAQSVERIVAGLRWRAVRPPLMVVGPASASDLDEAQELGATIVASLAFGIL
jgi:multimeric flavodoxin WrbA